MKTPVASTPPPNISNEYSADMLLAMEQRLLSAMEGWRTQALEDNNRGNDNKCKNTSTDVDDKEETKVVIDPLKTENAVSDNMETGEIKIDSDDEEYIATQAEADDKAPTNDNDAFNTDKEDTQSTLLIAPTEPENIITNPIGMVEGGNNKIEMRSQREEEKRENEKEVKWCAASVVLCKDIQDIGVGAGRYGTEDH